MSIANNTPRQAGVGLRLSAAGLIVSDPERETILEAQERSRRIFRVRPELLQMRGHHTGVVPFKREALARAHRREFVVMPVPAQLAIYVCLG